MVPLTRPPLYHGPTTNKQQQQTILFANLKNIYKEKKKLKYIR